MKKIEKLKHIDTETTEGRLLVCAISKLQRLKPGATTDDIIKNLNELSEKIYYDASNYTATNNQQRNPRPFLEATNGGTNETRKDRNADLGD